ncbi:MAG: hypothetical protein NVS9B10_19320 [Nevskia sp.]
MKLAFSQRGLGLWSGLFVFGTIGFVALCVIKVGPLYLNEVQIKHAVHDVASKEGGSSGGEVDVAAIRSALQRRWDIDYLSQIQPKDIKVVRTDKGLFLSYDYDAVVKLFANISVIAHFQDDVPLRAAAGS